MKLCPALYSVVFTLVVTVSSLAADETPAPENNQPGPPKPQLMSLDFPGGTLSEFIALLNKTKSPINLMADKAEQDVQLPAITLRNVNGQDVGLAMAQWLRSRGLTLGSSGQFYTPGAGNPVYFVTTDPAGPGRFQSFAPFQLWQQLEYQNIDDIVAAIRNAWELDPAHNPADLKLKFHPPTTVLLVVGPNQAIEIATRVIGSLKAAPLQTPPPKSKDSPVPKP
jgi:hypothetical protein